MQKLHVEARNDYIIADLTERERRYYIKNRYGQCARALNSGCAGSAAEFKT